MPLTLMHQNDIVQPAPALNVPAIPLPPPKKVSRYMLAIRPGDPAPAWFHSVAGICFCQTSSTFTEDGTETKKIGSIMELEVDQLKALREALRHRIVRWIYKTDKKTQVRTKAACDIYDTRITGFRPERGDEPLEPYLMFEKVADDYVQPPVSGELLTALDEAVAQAEKSETKAQQDPRDASTREKHGRARANAQKLEPDEMSV